MHIQNLKTKAQKITSGLVLFALVFGLGAFTAPQAAKAAVDVRVGVSGPAAYDNEGVSTEVVFTASDASHSGIDVGFTISGNATSGSDFIFATTSPLRIPANQTSVSVPLNILSDALVEGSESINFNIESVVAVNPGVDSTRPVGDPNSFMYTILDLPTIDFAGSVVGFTEGEQDLITVQLSGNNNIVSPTQAVTFNWTITNGTTDGSDYVAASGTGTIPAGQLSATIDLGIADDDLNELDENFFIAISNPVNAVLGSNITKGVSISDNDTVYAQFQQSADAGLENLTFPQFSVVLSNPSTRPVRVYFKNDVANTTADRGINADWEFTSTLYTTVEPGTTTKDVTSFVTIYNDLADETNEVVALLITTSTPSGDYLVAEPGTNDLFTYTIIDNDGANSPELNLSTSSPYVFTEGQEGSFTVYLSTTTSEPVTFEWATNGTATAGVDYADGSADWTTSTIPAGELSKTVYFNIVNDNLDEEQESIGLSLGFNPINATLGTSRYGNYAIIDNDTSVAQFSTAASSGAENTASATINLVLSNPSDREILVTLKRHASSTADVGTEWTMATDTVVFAPGVTSSPFNFTVIDDGNQESSETVVFTLTGAVNADLSGELTHTYTITDNDTPVSSGGGGGGGGSSSGGSSVPVPVTATSTAGATTTENLSVRVDSLVTIGDVTFANLVLNGGTAARMSISNSPAFENAVQEPYRTNVLWKLPAGNGTKTIYVRFFNNVGAAFPVVTTNATVSGQAEGGQVLGEQVSLLDELVARLKYGTTSDEVRQLQTLLQQKGYFAKTFRPTRYYGLMTKAAVARYLTDKQMASMTLGELIQVLKFGTRSSLVTKLQTELKKLGFFPANVAVTNYYGLVTKAAVAKYQASR